MPTEINTTLHSYQPAVVDPNFPPRELDLPNFLYEAIDPSSFIDVKSWSQFFDLIPVDPYIKEGYRYKAIAWFRVKHNKADANEGIDERIAAVNQLSGMEEEERLPKFVNPLRFLFWMERCNCIGAVSTCGLSYITHRPAHS